MRGARNFLLMTTAAALCAAPMLAFGQANTGGSSQMQGTTQTTPNQGALGGTPAARGAATTGSDTGNAPTAGAAAQGQGRTTDQTGRATGTDARGGVTAQNQRDGTPGNPPSTATQRALDSVTGQRTDPDGTGNNPPGTAAGRALDRATDGASTGTTTTPGTTTTTQGGTTTTTTRPGAPATTGTTAGTAATGAATAGDMAVDSARLQGGRRASKLIGSNVYNEANESVGEVDDIIVPQGGGQPVAVLSVGGFLGIGARLVAIPYERLQYNAERERWMLQGATRDSVRSMTEYRYEEDRRG